jgi:hypothetical protein
VSAHSEKGSPIGCLAADDDRTAVPLVLRFCCKSDRSD